MELIFFVFVIVVLGGIAYLSTKFFDRFTKNSQYHLVLNGLVFVLSFVLCVAIAFFIFISTVTFER